MPAGMASLVGNSSRRLQSCCAQAHHMLLQGCTVHFQVSPVPTSTLDVGTIGGSRSSALH
eukprot:682954-Amphidinium_carterae.1